MLLFFCLETIRVVSVGFMIEKQNRLWTKCKQSNCQYKGIWHNMLFGGLHTFQEMLALGLSWGWCFLNCTKISFPYLRGIGVRGSVNKLNLQIMEKELILAPNPYPFPNVSGEPLQTITQNRWSFTLLSPYIVSDGIPNEKRNLTSSLVSKHSHPK